MMASLKKIVGEDNIITEIDKIRDYLTDEAPKAIKPKPAEDIILIKPKN